MKIKNNMSEEFYDWLNECPNQWFLDKHDKDSNTYTFIVNDNELNK
jgi:hypothetical protein